jgi:hypothetical protein
MPAGIRNWKLTFYDGTTQWQLGRSSYDAVRTWLSQHSHLNLNVNHVIEVQNESGVIINPTRWR